MEDGWVEMSDNGVAFTEEERKKLLEIPHGKRRALYSTKMFCSKCGAMVGIHGSGVCRACRSTNCVQCNRKLAYGYSRKKLCHQCAGKTVRDDGLFNF